MKVLAAMSGGVDSAVAAARMVAAGHDVTGVHLALFRSSRPELVGTRGCCSIVDANDARRTAELLDIPFYVWDFSELFATEVVDNFTAEYARGRTPNPCLRCNERIKFAAVTQRGIALGYDAVATGHYARLMVGDQGIELHRAVDAAKDQSYVLGVLDRDQLSHSLFPLGDSLKSEVRAEAAAMGLRVATKPDSTDICFIPDGDTAGFLDRALGSRPGEIVNVSGEVIGTHQGTHRFTIGQRKGLELSRPAADGRPRYVLGIEPVSRRVIVGGASELRVSQVRGVDPIWAGDVRQQAWRGEIQVRAHGAPVAASIRCIDTADGPELIADLERPITAVASGQAMVCYEGDRVIGSATITATHPTEALFAQPTLTEAAATPSVTPVKP